MTLRLLLLSPITTTACEATIQWRTLGAATTKIDYGASSALGKTLEVTTMPGKQHSARMGGLAPDRTFAVSIRTQVKVQPKSKRCSNPLLPVHRLRCTWHGRPKIPTGRSIGHSQCDLVAVAPGTYQLAETLQCAPWCFSGGRWAGSERHYRARRASMSFRCWALRCSAGFTIHGAMQESMEFWRLDCRQCVADDHRQRNPRQPDWDWQLLLLETTPCISKAQIRNHVVWRTSMAALSIP